MRRYFDLFDRGQILVLLFEEVLTNNRESIRKAYEFLGVDSTFVPSWNDKIVNAHNFTETRSNLRKMRLGWTVHWAKRMRMDVPLRKVLMRNKQKMHSYMRPETRRRLEEYYGRPNEELSKLIQRDLSAWERAA